MSGMCTNMGASFLVWGKTHLEACLGSCLGLGRVDFIPEPILWSAPPNTASVPVTAHRLSSLLEPSAGMSQLP